VTVNWTQPLQPNGLVAQYIVRYSRADNVLLQCPDSFIQTVRAVCMHVCVRFVNVCVCSTSSPFVFPSA
jgi:hypothetical protein